MLTVTENAREVLKEILSANSNDPEMGLRLIIDGDNQIKMALGAEEQGDQVIEHDGTKVLMVPSALITVFEGITIDAEETDDGPKLVVQRDQ
jgi:Fe-S cluster assembly iron-binding protein IscA